MQRTESASSSATAHPLDHGADQPKASSSSTSSSPTFQSNSSSAHKISSTLASSLQTAGSHSSFQAPAGNKILLHEGTTVPPAFARTNGQTNGAQRSPQNVEEHRSNEQGRSRVLAKTPLWEERRYTELDDDSYSAHDEQSPIKYPPFSEEEQEARRIEQKLEQWAVQEKSRRKAKRSSRTASVLLTTPTNTGRFGKRMSALGQMANNSSGRSQQGQSTLTEPTPAAFDDTYGNSTTVNGAAPYAKRNSIGSTDALVGSGTSAFRDASASVTDLRSQKEGSVDSSVDSETMLASRRKGKGREVSDPFQDPQPPSSYSKPSARRPIVTPGRAPTIRHRALERARTQDNGMPAIVASDADEEQEARNTLDRFNSLEDDPFQTASERATVVTAAEEPTTKQQRPTIKTNVSSYTIGSTVEERSPETPKRKSTNSRFNEIGLDNEEDAAGWPMDDSGGESKEATTPRQAKGRKHAYNGNTMMDRIHRKSDVGDEDEDDDDHHEHLSRAPWWTEWLCGCGPPTDADLEQSGRTFPE